VQRGAAYLDEVLALGLGHERLQLGCGECVHQARLGHDEEQHLGAGEDGQLVCLACRVSSERGAVVFLMRRDGSARAQPWTRMRCDVRETNGYAPSS
jgi:hypothetical protein